RQVERDNAPALVDPTDRDLENPMEVDPRSTLSREGEGIRARYLTGLADQVTCPEVPVEIGILEGKDPQQKGQGQEQDDQACVREPGHPQPGLRGLPPRVRGLSALGRNHVVTSSDLEFGRLHPTCWIASRCRLQSFGTAFKRESG